MTTKELIRAELDNLDEESLNKLYKLVKELSKENTEEKKSSFMSRLKRIKINAPEDFSKNLDQYASGEKRID